MSAKLQLLTAEPRWLSAADLARFIRADLKAAFPGVKFSVRSRTYSMGSSVDVSYAGGPETSAVRDVAERYQGIGFDGSDDSTHYHPVTLPSGEVVRASSYICVQRDGCL
jgi:hypothetical protein